MQIYGGGGGGEREGNRKKKFGRIEIRTTNRLHVNHVW